MPNYAYVYADLRCPACGTAIAPFTMMQWGYCGGYFQTEGSMYQVGDSINWRACADGSIRPWTYFDQGRDGDEANIGDPAYADLIVCNRWYYASQNPATRRRCAQCHTPLDGVAVEIRGGVIRRAWVFVPGELGDIEADILLVISDGSLEPKPDWDDHVMDRIATC